MSLKQNFKTCPFKPAFSKDWMHSPGFSNILRMGFHWQIIPCYYQDYITSSHQVKSRVTFSKDLYCVMTLCEENFTI